MKVLVSNVGSTSLKFKLFDMPEERVLCEARVERVGSLDDAIYQYRRFSDGYSSRKEGLCVPDYSTGIKMFLSDMTSKEHGVLTSAGEVGAVGFKTVLAKGFYGVHELDEAVLSGMRDRLFVAPAHNGPYLEAIGQFRHIMPDASMIGVFETAFHTTIPFERRIYPVPYEWYERYDIVRMGYHGASHAYIAQEAKADRLISCHFGGSCSVCAILDGKSVDCSFGFSLQTGLPHAQRCGDADPYIIPYLMNEGLTEAEILDGLSKRGGLLGVSGVSGDLRAVQEAADAGNSRAALAIDMFAASIIRYIGAYYAELGGLDKMVFTGGIGENSSAVRSKVCSGLGHMGIRLDEDANARCRGNGMISAADSPVVVEVIAANEELGVARKTHAYVLDKNKTTQEETTP